MKLAAFLLATVLFPAFAAADGMITAVLVLDRPTFDKLLSDSGAVAKIPTEALFKSSVHIGFVKETYSDSFRVKEQRYQILATRAKDGSAIYAISLIRPKPEGPVAQVPADQLICVGAVGSGAEAKVDLGEDPLVVVFRLGDFLKE